MLWRLWFLMSDRADNKPVVEAVTRWIISMQLYCFWNFTYSVVWTNTLEDTLRYLSIIHEALQAIPSPNTVYNVETNMTSLCLCLCVSVCLFVCLFHKQKLKEKIKGLFSSFFSFSWNSSFLAKQAEASDCILQDKCSEKSQEWLYSRTSQKKMFCLRLQQMA